jgi:hypothetical protein
VASRPPSMPVLMAQRPYIGSDRGELGLRELGAAHPGHRGSVLLRLGYAVGAHLLICRGRNLDSGCKSRRGAFSAPSVSVPGAPRTAVWAHPGIPNHRSCETLPGRCRVRSRPKYGRTRSVLRPHNRSRITRRTASFIPIVAVIRHRGPPRKSEQPPGGRARRLTFTLALEHYEMVTLLGQSKL